MADLKTKAELEAEEEALELELEETELRLKDPIVQKLLAAAEAKGRAQATTGGGGGPAVHVSGKRVSADDVVVRALKDLPGIRRGAVSSASARTYTAKAGENIYMNPSHAADLSNPLGKQTPGQEAWVVKL